MTPPRDRDSSLSSPRPPVSAGAVRATSDPRGGRRPRSPHPEGARPETQGDRVPAARGVSPGSSGVPAGSEANRARRSRPGAPRPPGQVRVEPGGGRGPRREAGRRLGLSRAAAYGATPRSPGGLPGSASARAG